MAINLIETIRMIQGLPARMRGNEWEDNSYGQGSFQTEISQKNQLELLQPLPPYSSILGICDDGLPLLLDLNDPTPGAILISGRETSGKTRFIKSVLSVSSALNPADYLNFFVITPNPGIYREIEQFNHCLGIISAYDRAACELVVELSAMIEQRKCGRHLGAKTILAIDNLFEFLKHDDFEVKNHLKWLVKYGATNGLWVISAIGTEQLEFIDEALLDSHTTRILAGYDNLLLPNLSPEQQMKPATPCYHTRIGMDWVDFWLPSVT